MSQSSKQQQNSKSSSSSSLDKVPVKQSKPNSKHHSSKQLNLKSGLQLNNIEGSRTQNLKGDASLNSNMRREINDLVNQSSLLLGSIKDQIENQGRKINESGFTKSQNDGNFRQQLCKIKVINDELDDIIKESNQLADKFKKKDNSMQVNQNCKTGELRSNMNNISSIPSEINDSKSIQASIQNPKHPKYIDQRIKSGVSSVVNKVPSDNPLSNELRIIMKHEGIQTDQKQKIENKDQQVSRNEMRRAQSQTQVPKLQLPIGVDKDKIQTQQNVSHENWNKNNLNNYNLTKTGFPPQSRFAIRTASRQMQNQDLMRMHTDSNLTQNTYNQNKMGQRHALIMQDFYRHGQTNISQIQQQLNLRSQTQNQSYQNFFQNNYHRINTQSTINQNNQQQSLLIQNQPVNPYHHLRDPPSTNNPYPQAITHKQQQYPFPSGISTGRFSIKSSQSIQNVDQAMAILLN